MSEQAHAGEPSVDNMSVDETSVDEPSADGLTTGQPPGYILRPMRLDDIAQVVAIDRVAFPTPWTANVYRYEIAQNSLSSMVVLTAAHPPPPFPANGQGRMTRLLKYFQRNGPAVPGDKVLGYGGFWFSRQEAHISTIASHPDYRGRSLGELLLASMIRRGLNMRAAVISLEVRVGNDPAIALYEKYHFQEFGIKQRYYRDNGEDAYDMRVSPINAAYRRWFEAQWAGLQDRLACVDVFTRL